MISKILTQLIFISFNRFIKFLILIFLVDFKSLPCIMYLKKVIENLVEINEFSLLNYFKNKLFLIFFSLYILNIY